MRNFLPRPSCQKSLGDDQHVGPVAFEQLTAAVGFVLGAHPLSQLINRDVSTSLGRRRLGLGKHPHR